jgi:hypothetical protein
MFFARGIEGCFNVDSIAPCYGCLIAACAAYALGPRDHLAPRAHEGLQIVGLQPCCLGDANEHARADLVAIVKGKNIVRPTIARQGTMRAGGTLDPPSDPKKCCEDTACSRRAPCAAHRLRRRREQSEHGVRHRLTVLQAIGGDAQRQSLGRCCSTLARVAVRQHPRKLRHFGDPPAVVFAVDLDEEAHKGNPTTGRRGTVRVRSIISPPTTSPADDRRAFLRHLREARSRGGAAQDVPQRSEERRGKDYQREEPQNTLLHLTSPDAAQSVPRPLCLLSGLAGEQHVRYSEKRDFS